MVREVELLVRKKDRVRLMFGAAARGEVLVKVKGFVEAGRLERRRPRVGRQFVVRLNHKRELRKVRHWVRRGRVSTTKGGLRRQQNNNDSNSNSSPRNNNDNNSSNSSPSSNSNSNSSPSSNSNNNSTHNNNNNFNKCSTP